MELWGQGKDAGLWEALNEAGTRNLFDWWGKGILKSSRCKWWDKESKPDLSVLSSIRGKRQAPCSWDRIMYVGQVDEHIQNCLQTIDGREHCVSAKVRRVTSKELGTEEFGQGHNVLLVSAPLGTRTPPCLEKSDCSNAGKSRRMSLEGWGKPFSEALWKCFYG